MFIDELHLIVGAGAAEGSMDAGNILKPSLARGKIHMIGATTTDEYTRYVEKDAALERRFQPIQVPETTSAETLAILKGLRKHYEEFHGVKVSDEVLGRHGTTSPSAISMTASCPIRPLICWMKHRPICGSTRARRHLNCASFKKSLSWLIPRIDDAVDSEDYEKAAREKQRASQLNDKNQWTEATHQTGKPITITLGRCGRNGCPYDRRASHQSNPFRSQVPG